MLEIIGAESQLPGIVVVHPANGPGELGASLYSNNLPGSDERIGCTHLLTVRCVA